LKTLDTKQVEQQTQAPDLRGSSSIADDSVADASVENFSVVEIKKLHNELLALRETVFGKAVRIGELLVANKAAFGKHGRWLKWLKKNITFSDQTARNYIRIYENRDDPKFKSVLNLTDAYALLAKKTDREAARANGKRTPHDDFGGDTTPVAEPERTGAIIHDQNQPAAVPSDSDFNAFMERFRTSPQERKLVSEFALKIIDTGFNALSLKGGSADAMLRLRAAKEQLDYYSVW
jgi:hypothetical protein